MKWNHSSHIEMLKALLDRKVDFLLVGGYAVVFHGYVRSTADMDIWFRPTTENLEKMIGLFRELQFEAEDIQTLQQYDLSKVLIFHVGESPERIDFLSRIVGPDFESAWKRREFLVLDNHRIPVLSLDALLENKQKSGRPKDLADVDQLLKISNRNK